MVAQIANKKYCPGTFYSLLFSIQHIDVYKFKMLQENWLMLC